MNKIQKYLAYRQNLIEQYIRGDMNKSEYLEENLNAVLSLGIKPFKNIDTVEKGLFNYQYYNAMAKEAKILSNTYRDYEYENLNEANYYYSCKDKSTIAILKLVDFKSVTAYFIKVRSLYLKGRLIEIIVEECNAVLHTKNPVIINMLRKEGVFTEGVRISCVDGYINQRY